MADHARAISKKAVRPCYACAEDQRVADKPRLEYAILINNFAKSEIEAIHDRSGLSEKVCGKLPGKDLNPRPSRLE